MCGCGVAVAAIHGSCGRACGCRAAPSECCVLGASGPDVLCVAMACKPCILASTCDISVLSCVISLCICVSPSSRCLATTMSSTRRFASAIQLCGIVQLRAAGESEFAKPWMMACKVHKSSPLSFTVGVSRVKAFGVLSVAVMEGGEGADAAAAAKSLCFRYMATKASILFWGQLSPLKIFTSPSVCHGSARSISDSP